MTLEDENAELRRRLAEAEERAEGFERQAEQAEREYVPPRPLVADGGDGGGFAPDPWDDPRSDRERSNEELRDAIADKRYRRVWGGLWNDRPSLRPGKGGE